MAPPIRINLLNELAAPAQAAAAALYWQAFAGKLHRLFGPAGRAMPMICAGMEPSHALAARDADGLLIGVGGFRTAQGCFIRFTPALIAAHYGATGARWRLSLLRLLGTDNDTESFQIDGLCVAPGRRGQGTGSALIEALSHEARARGHALMRLDVARHNHRAIALYRRHGFEVARLDHMPLAWPVFGVSACLMMERRL